MYCNQCGTALPEGSRFCPGCGAPVTTDTNQNAAQKAAYSAGIPCYFIPVQPMAFPQPSAESVPFAVPGAPASPEPPQPAYRRKKKPVSFAPAYGPAEDRDDDTASPDPEQDDGEHFDGISSKPEPCASTEALTFWQILLSLVALLYLPIGNIIFACVWAFGEKVHPTRRRLAQAALPLITLSLLSLFGILLFLTFNLRGFSFTLK